MFVLFYFVVLSPADEQSVTTILNLKYTTTMKQILLSIPKIIEGETRVSWIAFKVALIAAAFASLAFFILEQQ